jgi:hypothetical protein
MESDIVKWILNNRLACLLMFFLSLAPIFDTMLDTWVLSNFVQDSWYKSATLTSVVLVLNWRFAMLFAALKPMPTWNIVLLMFIPGFILPFKVSYDEQPSRGTLGKKASSPNVLELVTMQGEHYENPGRIDASKLEGGLAAGGDTSKPDAVSDVTDKGGMYQRYKKAAEKAIRDSKKDGGSAAHASNKAKPVSIRNASSVQELWGAFWKDPAKVFRDVLEAYANAPLNGLCQGPPPPSMRIPYA